MKKTLLSLVAGLFLLCSAAANAGEEISAPDVPWLLGNSDKNVTLKVSLESGDISLGGAFHIGFDPKKLSLQNEFIGGTSDFYPLFLVDKPLPDLVNLSLVYAPPPIDPGDPINPGALPPYPSGPIFSLVFEVLAQESGKIPVDISWFVVTEYDQDDNPIKEDVLAKTTPFIIVEGDDQNIPEPGALALVGLALLIMTGVGRRNRMNRG